MNYRDQILAELKKLYDDKGPNNYALADTLNCFEEGNQDFLVTISQLLAEGLIIGVSMENTNRVAIAINPEKYAIQENKTSPINVNNVTINLGANASFTGPLNVGQTISQAYNTSVAISNDKLREHLEHLTLQVSELVEIIESPDKKTEISEDLKLFVEQSTKGTPNKKFLKVTSDGLIEAAKAVADFAKPIAETVGLVLKILSIIV